MFECNDRIMFERNGGCIFIFSISLRGPTYYTLKLVDAIYLFAFLIKLFVRKHLNTTQNENITGMATHSRGK